MKSLKDQTVFITGASSGIGKATAYEFAELGANLVLSARRINRLDDIARDIKDKFDVKVYSFKLNVKDKEAVKNAIDSLPEEFKSIDILVNNAGLARGVNKLFEDDPENWEEMIDTNVKGLLYVSRYIVPGMIERGSGHVINLGSTAGHEAYPKGAVYCSTKHSVNAITKSLRMDLIDKNIRVSSVDPGAVETEFSVVRFDGDAEKAKNVYAGITPLVAKDVAEAIVFCATRPAHANIAEIIMMPSDQASALIFNR